MWRKKKHHQTKIIKNNSMRHTKWEKKKVCILTTIAFEKKNDLLSYLSSDCKQIEFFKKNKPIKTQQNKTKNKIKIKNKANNK